MNTEMQSTAKTALIAAIVIITSACSDNPPPEDYSLALELLNDKWDGGCRENPSSIIDPDRPVGYYRETLEIDGFFADQTFEYFQDADCSVAVDDGQVADQEQSITLRKQSQQFSVAYPFGTTTTALGVARHLDLTVESVAIDDVTLTEEALEERGIELVSLLGIYIITDSDRLHLGTTTVNSRPSTVPLDYSYIRAADE